MGERYVPDRNKVRYEDHTADLWMTAEGADEQEVITNMLTGLYSTISEEFTIDPAGTLNIEFHGGSLEEVLINVLSEALFLFDARSVLILRPTIGLSETKGGFKAVLTGSMAECTIPPEKGGFEVKAVTHHKAEMCKEGARWKGRVLLDL